MPGKVKIKILACRNLPIMDRSNETTDAYVEIKLGNITQKTDVKRKSLNPQFNSDWFRFDVDDEDLQDEPLQIRVMDYDTYSANDAIGKVSLSLNPLLLSDNKTSSSQKSMSGWYPIFCTMQGIRGEINFIVKVDVFPDANKFRQSSCGIQFFVSPNIPFGYNACIRGFVEELVVDDDPEYAWIDKIRRASASNEARQVAFLKLAGQVQRKIGLKVINMGGNAVVGFQQHFDLERDTVVVRGIGTCVTLVKIHNDLTSTIPEDERKFDACTMNQTNENNKPDKKKRKGDVKVVDSDRSESTSIKSHHKVDDKMSKVKRFLTFGPKKASLTLPELPRSQSLVEAEKKRDSFLEPEHAKSLLSVPTVSKDDLDSLSYKSTIGDSSEESDDDDDLDTYGSTNIEAETVTMVMQKILAQEEKEQNYTVDSINKIMHTGTTRITRNKGEISASEIIETQPNAGALEQMFSKNDENEGTWIMPHTSREYSIDTESSVYSNNHKHDLLHGLKEKLHNIHMPHMPHFHHDNTVRSPDSPVDPLHPHHTFKENVSEKFHQIADKIHHFHLPHLHENHHEDNLIAQAMQTILIDKFNILEMQSGIPEIQPEPQPPQKRRSSLQSIKQKFSLFNRPRRSVDMSSEKSLKPISEVHGQGSFEKTDDLTPADKDIDFLEMKIDTQLSHNTTSTDNISLTSLPQELIISVNEPSDSEASSQNSASASIDNKLSINNSDVSLSSVQLDNLLIDNRRKTFKNNDTETNKTKFLHGSLLSLKNRNELSASPVGTGIPHKFHARTESVGNKFSQSPKITGTPGSLPGREIANICRRSSDSDLSITPSKGNSLNSGHDRNGGGSARMPLKVPLNLESLDILEYPFLTLNKFPRGFIKNLGATVAARSVKLFDKVPNPDEVETRDSWWHEIRMEIRSHARSLGCNVILGYSESTSISDDVCVLSATGTAACINLQYTSDVITGELDTKKVPTANANPTNPSEEPTIEERNVKNINETDAVIVDENIEAGLHAVSPSHNFCNLCHVPYSKSNVQAGTVNMTKCFVCKKGYVPDIILSTIELPEGMQVVGLGCLIQGCVCRPKRDLRSESNAKEISDGLPFLEYELHRLLINKLKVKGMNAIFGLNVQITVGEKMMALIATGTAVYLSALHPPIIPKIVAGNSWNDSEKLAELQRSIQITLERNREIYQLQQNHPELDNNKLGKNFSDTDDSDNEEKVDYSLGNKSTCILEIDDVQDLEVVSMIMEPSPPEGIHIVNTQSIPGGQETAIDAVRNLQMFTQVWRTKIPSHQVNSNFSKHFQNLLQSIFFKLRTIMPCAICDIRFQLDLPADEIQLLITGMVLKTKPKGKIVPSVSRDDDMMFNLDEDVPDNPLLRSPRPNNYTVPSRLLKKTPVTTGHFSQMRHMTIKNDRFVDISPLSWVPGGKIEKYLGNLNFFFIRESTNVRDGGICGFVHSFITELLAVVRAHIQALGANSMISFYMTELILIDNPHKNQAQCLVNVGGDAVYVTYAEDQIP